MNSCTHPRVGRLGAYTNVTCPDCKKVWTPEEFRAFIAPAKKGKKKDETVPTDEKKEDETHE